MNIIGIVLMCFFLAVLALPIGLLAVRGFGQEGNDMGGVQIDKKAEFFDDLFAFLISNGLHFVRSDNKYLGELLNIRTNMLIANYAGIPSAKTFETFFDNRLFMPEKRELWSSYYKYIMLGVDSLHLVDELSFVCFPYSSHRIARYFFENKEKFNLMEKPVTINGETLYYLEALL